MYIWNIRAPIKDIDYVVFRRNVEFPVSFNPPRRKVPKFKIPQRFHGFELPRGGFFPDVEYWGPLSGCAYIGFMRYKQVAGIS